MRLSENDYSVARLHIAHAFDGARRVVTHDDPEDAIVGRIGVERRKL